MTKREDPSAWGSATPSPVVELRLNFALRADAYYVTANTLGFEPVTAKTELAPHGLRERSASIAGATRHYRRRRGAAATDELPPPPDVLGELADVGSELFHGVFAGAVNDVYRAAREHAERDRALLRIVLGLKETPELLPIPWEALREDLLYLAIQDRTALVRAMGATPLHPVMVGDRLRVLGVIANPEGTGQEPLDVDAEKRRVTDALSSVVEGGLVQLDWLEPATLTHLQSRLRDGYHVLHYIGHSAAATSDSEAVLVLEDDVGYSAPLSGTDLANLLGRRTTLRLVVLNSCESALTIDGDPFSAVATALVRLGLPAVVAMQYALSDAAAVAFGSALYRGIVGRSRGRLEEAISDARLSVMVSGHDADWASPVLYLSAPDSRIFDLSLIGWYTLDGSKPAQSPEEWRPGFLGLSVFDPFDRAVALLGSSYAGEYSDAGPPVRVHRVWDFREHSRVAVTHQDEAIVELSISIGDDESSPMRVALPYGLVLGESTLGEADSIIRARFSPDYRAHNPVGPVRKSFGAENLYLERRAYLCPDGPMDTTFHLEVGATVLVETARRMTAQDWDERLIRTFVVRVSTEQDKRDLYAPPKLANADTDTADDLYGRLDLDPRLVPADRLRELLDEARQILGDDADDDALGGVVTILALPSDVWDARLAGETAYLQDRRDYADKLARRVQAMRRAIDERRG